jgi:hypothetical protein
MGGMVLGASHAKRVPLPGDANSPLISFIATVVDPAVSKTKINSCPNAYNSDAIGPNDKTSSSGCGE